MSKSITSDDKLMNPASQSLEVLKLDPVSDLVDEIVNVNDITVRLMAAEVITDDESVLPVPRPSIVECPIRYQSPSKEFPCSSFLSKTTDFDNRYEFLRSIGLNVDELLADFHCWNEEQDSLNSDILDYLFSIDDEKSLVYIKQNLLLLAKQLEDDHGCGEVCLAKEIIACCIIKNVYPSFSFDERQIEEFVKQSVSCSSYGQMRTNRDIFIYVIRQKMKSSCQRKLMDRLEMFGVNDERNIFLYHGTTENSAQSMIVNGIRLKSHNSRIGDFGLAFYTTEHLGDAIHRAEVKSERTMGREKPALLIFQLNKEQFDQQTILRLQYSTNSQDPWIKPNTEDLTNEQVLQWSVLVSLCLTNNPPEQFMDQYDCIIGPTTENLREIVIGNRPKMKICDGRVVSQVAIVSTKMKHFIMDGLKAMVIWEGRN